MEKQADKKEKLAERKKKKEKQLAKKKEEYHIPIDTCKFNSFQLLPFVFIRFFYCLIMFFFCLVRFVYCIMILKSKFDMFVFYNNDV